MSDVFAFEWCNFTFESSFEAVSLHATKAGAWWALRRRLLAEAADARDDDLRYGKSRHKWSEFKAWRVRRIEVLP